MATTLDQPQFQSDERNDLLNRWLARAYTINWEVVAYVVILAIAIFTRFSGLGDRVMSHDESLHTQFSYYLYQDGNFRHDPLMHGPILFHVTAFFYFLFGDNDFVARIYPALLGVGMVMLPLLFRRWLGRTGTLLASIMMLASPLLLYYQRYIREDIPSIFATLIVVWCVFSYLDGSARWRRKAIWLYVFSGAMLWSLGSKEVAFMYVAIFGLFMTLYWLVRLYQHFFKVPARTLFYFISIAVLIAGITAMIMYAVLAIAFHNVVVQERLGAIFNGLSGIFSGQPMTPEVQSFIVWTLLVAAFFVLILVGTMLWANRRGNGRLRPTDILIILALALAFSLVLIVVEERSFVSSASSSGEEVAELATPTIPDVPTTDVEGNPLIPVTVFFNEIGAGISIIFTNTAILVTWIISLAFIVLLIASRRLGWWKTLVRFPELDFLWLMGTFILPWITAVVIQLTGASPIDYSPNGVRIAVVSALPLLTLSVVAGLAWNWRRWLISASIFYILFAFFFTTMFTNPNGLATGMIGSLGYWLEQQGDRRGSQPQYYYSLIVMPIYEFLPLIGSFLAMLAGLTHFWKFRAKRLSESFGKRKRSDMPSADSEMPSYEAVVSEMTDQQRQAALFGKNRLRRLPFLLFVSWWAVFIFIAFTLAGEKMPWLATHITTPMIFLAAWYFGRVAQGVNWSTFRQRTWVYLLLLPVIGAALLQVVSPFILGEQPFAGLAQGQLQTTMQWLALVLVVVIIGWLIARVALQMGWMQFRRMIGVVVFSVLSLLTFRAAWVAAFINYDYANEFLVYAHGAPGIKTMVEQIEEISRRTTDGMNIRFAWGGNAWPVTWYFRHLTNAEYFRENPTLQQVENAAAIYVSADVRSRLEPLLEGRFQSFEYMRMWWPDQEYFNLTPERVLNTFDFSAENPQAAQVRRGIWDIWWARDYTVYGEAIGRDYSFTNWPVSERLYFYVRKDIAAQVWDLGAGVVNAEGGIPQVAETSICTSNWQQLSANSVYDSARGIVLNDPAGVAVSNDGTIYIADQNNNRIVALNQAGEQIATYGGDETSPVVLTRPNGIDIGIDGNLYIADTWAYRVQVLSPEGNALAGWGQVGQFGIEAAAEPFDALWAPRDIQTDPLGNVYVSDTGNKRVRVYTAAGVYIRDIGVGGSQPGQLDEPVGLEISPDGRLFVADTWNRRISVFNTQDGALLYTFDVLGWYEDLGNRPYLAADPVRNLLYVSDPDAARVIVYDTFGNCIGSFGQKGSPDDILDASTFATIGGIDVDANGQVYVTDLAANRVLRFDPFPAPPPMAEVAPETVLEMVEVGAPLGGEIIIETTAEAGQ